MLRYALIQSLVRVMRIDFMPITCSCPVYIPASRSAALCISVLSSYWLYRVRTMLGEVIKSLSDAHVLSKKLSKLSNNNSKKPISRYTMAGTYRFGQYSYSA